MPILPAFVVLVADRSRYCGRPNEPRTGIAGRGGWLDPRSAETVELGRLGVNPTVPGLAVPALTARGLGSVWFVEVETRNVLLSDRIVFYTDLSGHKQEKVWNPQWILRTSVIVCIVSNCFPTRTTNALLQNDNAPLQNNKPRFLSRCGFRFFTTIGLRSNISDQIVGNAQDLILRPHADDVQLATPMAHSLDGDELTLLSGNS